jgi:hypothetical protein
MARPGRNPVFAARNTSAFVLTALSIRFVLAALAGVALVVPHGTPALRRQLPLGPFLAVGALVDLLL